MLARTLAILLLLVAPVAAAAAPSSPTDLPLGIDRYVYAELALAQPDLTTLTVSGDIYAYRYDVKGKVYDADDLGNAYNGLNKYAGEATGNGFAADIESAVASALTRTLGSSFAGATITGVTATVDRTTLRPANGNPFDPPVKVTVAATVARTRAEVGLGSLSDAAVAAAFSAGAKVTSDFTLAADPGYRIVYGIGAPAAPAGLRFEPGTGVAADGRTLTIDIDNTLGGTATRAGTARLSDASATAPTAEDIRSAIEVQMGELTKGAAGIPVSVHVSADVRALDSAKRFPGALPPKVSLPFLNADGVRALKATGAIKDADIAKANEALLTTVKEDVERAFGPGPVVAGGLSSAELALAAAKPYDDAPPLRFDAVANTTYKVAGATADDIDLALRIGGTASVDLKLFAANGKSTSYKIHPPSIGEFASATGGAVADDGRTATFTVPANAQDFAASVALRGKDIPEFTAQDAEIGVVVDLQDLDVSIGKVAGGDFGNLVIELTVTGNLGVIEMPDELRGAVPSKLELEYLSSDAIRLLRDRGYLSDANLTKLEDKLLDQVAAKLSAALGGAIPVEGGIDRASLAPGLVSSPIAADKPVVFRASAKVVKPLAGGPVEPQAAIALYTRELPLTLPKIQDLDTVYTVILPRGLAVKDVQAPAGTTETGESEDGREQFTVRPQGESTKVTIAMAVTPTFVLAKFWPIVLLAVLLLVLIIGTPVALVMRKRGKAKSAAKK